MGVITLKKNYGNGIKILIFTVMYVSILYSQPLIDLEDSAQDFVLEVKQIVIPDFPGAFNASIIRWQDKFLMAFRIRNALTGASTFEIGLVFLDHNFDTIGKPQILEIRNDRASLCNRNQDPRLIVINNKLYIAYSNFIKINHDITRRMFVAQIHGDNELFFIDNPIGLQPFPGWSARWEKNWVPFNYNEQLLFAYSIFPHRILRPLLLGACDLESSTYSLINWDWGELRGGTPAQLDNGEYIAFFHSSKYLTTVHSQGKKIQHYFMGAYTFLAQPPFNITRISKEPIIGKNFYHGPEYVTWKPLRVVFPMGCIIDDNYIWVSYGRQDFEIWVTKFDKKGLYNSLIPCKQITDEEGKAIKRKQIRDQNNEFEYYREYDPYDPYESCGPYKYNSQEYYNVYDGV